MVHKTEIRLSIRLNKIKREHEILVKNLTLNVDTHIRINDKAKTTQNRNSFLYLQIYVN